MAITNTRITDLVPSEKLLGNTVNMLLRTENELARAGILANSPEIDAAASAMGPRKAFIPFLNPLDATVVNYSTDDITDAGDVGKLTADEFCAVRHDVNYAWGTSDLTRMVTQYEAMGGISAGLADYWMKILKRQAENALLAAGSKFTFGAGTDAFSLELLIDAAATKGIYADRLTAIVVSPLTYAKMQKMNAGNNFVPASATDLGFAQFAGFNVIKSARVGNTDSILVGTGALAVGYGTVPVPIEIERVANGGNGGGGDILHSRQSLIVHPQGLSYGALSGNPELMDDIADGSLWTVAVPDEQVAVVNVQHTA
jgi:hypothetical protein